MHKKKKSNNNKHKKKIDLAKFIGAPKDVKVGSCVPPHPKFIPWLMCCSHGEYNRATTFYDMERDIVHVCNILELHNKSCLLSSYGWLFLLDEDEGSGECFLFNPVTYERISLPKFPHDFGRSQDSGGMVGTMSAKPTDPNCVIAFAECYRTNITFYHLNRDDGWIRSSYVNDFDEGGGNLFSLISHHDVIYGLSYWWELVVLQFEPDSVKIIPQQVMQPSFPNDQLKNRAILVEPCDHDDADHELILVVKSYMDVMGDNSIFTVNVVKWDLYKKNWVNVESVGEERAIFMSNNYAIIKDIKGSNLKGDCIYINEGDDESRELHCFDMALQTTSTIVPWPKLISPWDSPLWVVPCNNILTLDKGE